ncbi:MULTISPECIES: hypothetical protein [Aerococcus]|uniref:Uncharacterized protein n=2 Tax=Lactobacillales TaxID=186826 RepID=A0A329PFE4_9LACT|nr:MULTISPECIES: hypothetical protein [Aerococcus]MDL5183597.1 hypothetical protein [Aerococcus mictus]KAA9237405.1 hypothetical protein F6I34_09580 [Aerococcus urinae]KAA9299544.1 hypothetical protein F6I08_02795 [Aerococcus tenax]MDK6291416.1 hypothetical protein [Aerococcus urinae]MDK6372425.1 hypothetical protein [Aerococcus urinae]
MEATENVIKKYVISRTDDIINLPKRPIAEALAEKEITFFAVMDLVAGYLNGENSEAELEKMLSMPILDDGAVEVMKEVGIFKGGNQDVKF